jgi:hypothetical protein
MKIDRLTISTSIIANKEPTKNKSIELIELYQKIKNKWKEIINTIPLKNHSVNPEEEEEMEGPHLLEGPSQKIYAPLVEEYKIGGQVIKEIITCQDIKSLAAKHLPLNVTSALKNHEKNWFSSNYFRDLLKIHHPFTEAIKKYISIPINMRYHELRKGDNTRAVGLCRLGVLSDMRNGWFSLKYLQDLNLKNHPERIKQIDKKIQDIKHYIDFSFLYRLTDGQKESAMYGLQLLENLKKDPTQLKSMIQERKNILIQQMLPYLITQIKHNPSLVQAALKENNGMFNLAHVCLLNQKKKQFDSTGWMHDERVEMEDMYTIFKEFNGKTIIFEKIDTKEVLIKDEIHLKYPDTELEGKKIKLNTFFLNYSVQGNTKNDGIQQIINQEQLNHLQEKTGIDVNSQVKQKKLGYSQAEEALYTLLNNQQLAVSTGCLSGKDRTGFVCARLMQRFLRPLIGEKNTPTPFEKDIIKPNSLASKVVQENTPKVHVLKVNPLEHLPGFNSLDKVKLVTDMIRAFILKI